MYKKKKYPIVSGEIKGNFESLLYYAFKYSDSAEQALLANANSGGENVARGAMLGSLFGASLGMKGFPNWMKDQLVDFDKIVIEN